MKSSYRVMLTLLALVLPLMMAGPLLAQGMHANLCTDADWLDIYSDNCTGNKCGICHIELGETSSNLPLGFPIKESLEIPDGMGGTLFTDVVFTSETGTNSKADGDETYDGICEVCHTTTDHHRNDGSDGTDHHDGEVCTECHPHNYSYDEKWFTAEGGIVINAVYTTDLRDKPKVLFETSEMIRYHVIFTIQGPGTYWVRRAYKVKDLSPTEWSELYLKKEILGAGTYHRVLDKPVPASAVAGDNIKLKVKVKMFEWDGMAKGAFLGKDVKNHHFTMVLTPPGP